ncbi:MAG: hypothetical protein WD960_12015 [Gemmatimonadota bacterium]
MEWINLAPMRFVAMVLHDAALSRVGRRDLGDAGPAAGGYRGAEVGG